MRGWVSRVQGLGFWDSGFRALRLQGQGCPEPSPDNPLGLRVCYLGIRGLKVWP